MLAMGEVGSAGSLPSNLTIEESANKFSVSTATIRNWIKTGYLEVNPQGLVSGASIAKFVKENIGNDKLVARANKSRKDSHDHHELQEKMLSLVASSEIDYNNISEEYQSQMSNSYRNKEGIYYTPQDTVKDFFLNIEGKLENLTFCDPCCGSGNFIIGALECGFSPENVYGFDIDPVAIALTKKRIFEHSGYISENIFQLDYVEYFLENPTISYDVIMTNPPWGKKLGADLKAKYSNNLGIKKSSDTSSVFFIIALQSLNHKGYLGFLLQEAFFNIETFSDTREKALSNEIIEIKDYGKLFKNLQTKAISIILRKSKPNAERKVKCQIGKNLHYRRQSSFLSNPKCIFNFNSTNDDATIIDHLFSLPHVSLDQGVDWGLGIVTGNNKKFVREKKFPNGVPVYRGSDIGKDSLKSPSSFIPSDLSLYQQVAPVNLYTAPEKIIYKFITNKPCFYVDSAQSYILNSANMIVLRDFPITHHQLAGLLNSELMTWLFEKLFSTHKILRADLTSLPIHVEYFRDRNEFNEETFLNYCGLQKIREGYKLISKFTSYNHV